MKWQEWKKYLTRTQWDAYVKGLIENSEDEFGVTKDGKPYFYGGPPNSAQSMPLLAWNDEQKCWEEPMDWDHDE